MEKFVKLKVNLSSGSNWSATQMRSFVQLLGQYRSQSPVFTPSRRDCLDHLQARKFEHGSSSSIPRGLQIVRAKSGRDGEGSTRLANGEVDNEKKVQPQAPNPPKFNFPNWARWMVGSLLTFLLPFCNFIWGSKLKRIEGEVEVVMGEVEKVAEVVEKVATVAEKVSEEVAESIPSDNSELKQAALWVEKVSKATEHDAQLTEDIIHKVGNVEQDIRDLETMVEPIIEKIIDGGSKGKQS